ncbi:thioesterase II family protein [Streptomyces sp. NPDC050485]|uniref:thioesterase II family protein n=1 Tax=Streptomyces sp. NPDC050485 TaxID=3365617 RepID=UPI00379B2D2E
MLSSVPMVISNSMGMSKQSPVLVPWSSAPGNNTALVGIPWAGAGATPFSAWGPVIDDAADVYGARLAGRESRQTQPPAASLAEAVAELAGELAALEAPRVALFGQCSGALLAYEVAKELHRSGNGPEVVHLLVGSQLPPRTLADRGVDAEQDLTRYVPEGLREEPELLAVLLPILAADMKLIADYAYAPGTPLDVPLTVFYGARDEELSRADVDGWRQETTGATDFREIADADHLFGGAAWLELARAIRTALV